MPRGLVLKNEVCERTQKFLNARKKCGNAFPNPKNIW